MMLLLQTILKHNCFQKEQEFYKLSAVIVMGSPISSITTEILKNLAQQIMEQALKSKIISYYIRYVDKFCILCNKIIITQKTSL
jgi:hypothetical protein